MTLESLIEKLGPIPYNNVIVNTALRCIQHGVSLEDGIVFMIKALTEQNEALIKQAVEAYWHSPQRTEDIAKAMEKVKEALKEKENR